MSRRRRFEPDRSRRSPHAGAPVGTVVSVDATDSAPNAVERARSRREQASSSSAFARAIRGGTLALFILGLGGLGVGTGSVSHAQETEPTIPDTTLPIDPPTTLPGTTEPVTTAPTTPSSTAPSPTSPSPTDSTVPSTDAPPTATTAARAPSRSSRPRTTLAPAKPGEDPPEPPAEPEPEPAPEAETTVAEPTTQPPTTVSTTARSTVPAAVTPSTTPAPPAEPPAEPLATRARLAGSTALVALLCGFGVVILRRRSQPEAELEILPVDPAVVPRIVPSMFARGNAPALFVEAMADRPQRSPNDEVGALFGPRVEPTPVRLDAPIVLDWGSPADQSMLID